MAKGYVKGDIISNKICHTSNLVKAIKKDMLINKYIYILSIPVILYYIVFHYAPMYGLIIAFKDFKPSLGIFQSKWVGFKHFETFFHDYSFIRVLRNTVLINLYNLIFGFPLPIIFALMINEIKNNKFKRISQTLTYMPHFISTVVICGIIKDFVSADGVVVQLLSAFGMEKVDLLSKTQLFRTIYVSTDIWQHLGWNSIIYIATLTNINPEYYESAVLDGASRMKQIIYITIPLLAPTIIILLILRIGQLMSLGWEKIVLLYNPLTYETADVIQSYVYRRGLLEYEYSFSSAVGMFNSVVNFVLVVLANKISSTFSETSLW